MTKTERVLVVPDLHAPAIHPKAFDFVRQIQDDWQTDRTVFLGDAMDLHAMSYHQKELGTKRIIDEVEEGYGAIASILSPLQQRQGGFPCGETTMT